MSTWLSLHYHLIFGTKRREPSIRHPVRTRLHEYLGGVVKGLGGVPNGIGGTSDHVHLLVTLRATHRLADFMRELKKSGSAWMRSTGTNPTFGWQDGYCALTVSASSRAKVHAYISNQEEHHRKRTFQEEVRLLLEQSGIDFDPKYLE